ncbi:MAG: hypothetical protein ACO4AV_10965 [bacterium]
MTQSTNQPFFKSYLLGRTLSLEDIKELSDVDLETLNIETLSALSDARHDYAQTDNRKSPESGQIFHRMKVASYFQAAILVEKNSM